MLEDKVQEKSWEEPACLPVRTAAKKSSGTLHTQQRRSNTSAIRESENQL